MLRAVWTSVTSIKRVIIQFASEKAEDLVHLRKLPQRSVPAPLRTCHSCLLSDTTPKTGLEFPTRLDSKKSSDSPENVNR